MATARTLQAFRIEDARDSADGDRMLVDIDAAIAWLPYLESGDVAALFAAQQALIREALALTEES